MSKGTLFLSPFRLVNLKLLVISIFIHPMFTPTKLALFIYSIILASEIIIVFRILLKAQQMKPFIPAKLEFIFFGFLLSGMMSSIVTFIAIVQTIGFTHGLFITWLETWLSSWVVAFPVVLVVAPLVRKTIHKLVVSTN
ncbi:DUF2798 domain-containing protein [Kiloniella antarctica]|uniref:DUF2798 domain-containing protein n=1 Tax=Kiloniella antarctica TaxID=1550907 RepID=A0ABW5BJB8_9PROT